MWSVQLVGEPSDLASLASALPEGEISISREGDEYLLRCTTFTGCEDARDVRSRAKQIVAVINGAATLAHDGPWECHVGNVYRANASGGRDRFLFAETGTLFIRGEAPTISITRADGAVEVYRPPNIVHDYPLLALHNGSVARVLRLLGEEPTWVDMYRILEIVSDDIGGEGEIVKRGWASKKAISRFSHTANSPGAIGIEARHGSERHHPPSRPMPFGEAHDLINRIVLNWLHELTTSPLSAESGRSMDHDRHPLREEQTMSDTSKSS